MKKALRTKLAEIVIIALIINIGLLFAVSAGTVKTIVLEEDWRLTAAMDINAGEGNVIVLDGLNKYTIYEMNANAVLTNSTGIVRLKNTAVISVGSSPAAESLAELYTAALSVTSVTAPAQDAASLPMPVVPGFTVAIRSSSNPDAIALNGAVTPRASPQTVDLVFTLSGNGGEADTAGISVTVPAASGGNEQVPSLGGSVAISGTAKYGQVFSANLTNVTNNVGPLSYLWKRGATEVGTGAAYTIVQADIGQSITVTVTGDGINARGSVTSPAVTPVKADGPSAPAAPTLASKTSASITLNPVTGAEYSKDNGATWQNGTVFTGLSSNTAYTFVLRIKETLIQFASANSASASVTTDAASGGKGNDSGSSITPVQPEAPKGTTSIKESGIIEAAPVLKPNSKQAEITIPQEELDKAAEKVTAGADGVKVIPVNVKKTEGANTYVAELSAAALSTAETARKIRVATEAGTLVVPANMLTAADSSGAEKVALSIGAADTSAIAAEVMAQIGGRPVVELKLQVNGETRAWSNPDAPVTVTIPYTPTAEELADPEHIVVWYVDGTGNVTAVPTGRYDAASGKVTFSTTHFSKYAVAYVNKTFNDIGGYSWAKKAIEVMASKGVIKGTSDTSYSPGAPIKRGDFIVLLVRALGLSSKVEGNFADVAVGPHYAEATAIAKKLGIATGVGGNKFMPEAYISRQDMMTLANRAIKLSGKSLPAGSTLELDRFTDGSKVAAHASEAVSTLVKNGIIVGSGNRINPLGETTRAEIAVIIYRIYTATAKTVE